MLHTGLPSISFGFTISKNFNCSKCDDSNFASNLLHLKQMQSEIQNETLKEKLHIEYNPILRNPTLHPLKRKQTDEGLILEQSNYKNKCQKLKKVPLYENIYEICEQKINLFDSFSRPINLNDKKSSIQLLETIPGNKTKNNQNQNVINETNYQKHKNNIYQLVKCQNKTLNICKDSINKNKTEIYSHDAHVYSHDANRQITPILDREIHSSIRKSFKFDYKEDPHLKTNDKLNQQNYLAYINLKKTKIGTNVYKVPNKYSIDNKILFRSDVNTNHIVNHVCKRITTGEFASLNYIKEIHHLFSQKINNLNETSSYVSRPNSKLNNTIIASSLINSQDKPLDLSYKKERKENDYDLKQFIESVERKQFLNKTFNEENNYCNNYSTNINNNFTEYLKEVSNLSTSNKKINLFSSRLYSNDSSPDFIQNLNERQIISNNPSKYKLERNPENLLVKNNFFDHSRNDFIKIEQASNFSKILDKDYYITYSMNWWKEFISTPNEDGNYPLHVAIMDGNMLTCEYLIKITKELGLSIDFLNKYMQTPLHLAIKFDDVKMVAMLARYSASPNCKDLRMNNAIHLSVINSQNFCLGPLIIYSSGPIDIDSTNDEGLSPLLLAVKLNRLIETDFLLKSGANVNLGDDLMGNRAIHYSVANNSARIAELLLINGSKIHLPNKLGLSVYSIMTSRKESDFSSELKNIFKIFFSM